MAQIPGMAWTPKYTEGMDFQPSLHSRRNLKETMLGKVAEAAAAMGLSDEKTAYRAGKEALGWTGLGGALDAGQAIGDWIKGEGGNPGLDIAAGLSGAMFIGPSAKLTPKLASGLEAARDYIDNWRNFKGVQFDPAAQDYTGMKIFEHPENEQLRQQTGWFMGPDKGMRTEIRDDKSLFFPQAALTGGPRKVPAAVDHPELLAAYPELADVSVASMSGPAYWGQFDPNLNQIRIDEALLRENPEAARRTMLHEIQHWIQEKEGFAQGNNPEYISSLATRSGNPILEADANQIYRRLLGEVEARSTASRAPMGAMRMAVPPLYPALGRAAVTPDQLIVTQDDLIQALAGAANAARQSK